VGDEIEGATMGTTSKVLGLVMAGGLLLAACGDDSGSSATDATTTTTAADSGSTTTAAGADATLSVSHDATLGDFLVGADGRTVYLFEKDQGTTSACTGACSANWPAVTTSGAPTAGRGVDQSKVDTAGTGQVTYGGHLLYEFAGDKAPGDTNGTAVSSWYAVGPDGKPIELGEDDDATTTTVAAAASGY
jgi:predicted lipoprotein with Yx(FWY)xxD motif